MRSCIHSIIENVIDGFGDEAEAGSALVLLANA
jgi:hypothetical protein